MYQPKVNNTQKYSDSQGEHLVAPAKLLLIEKQNFDRKTQTLWRNKSGQILHTHSASTELVALDSILISETEEIEKGDNIYRLYYNSEKNEPPIIASNSRPSRHWRKVLALPEHLSNKHLLAISEGKMKDGDKVLVKCEAYNQYNESDVSAQNLPKRVYLDQQNHITLFSAKQSLEKFIDQYMEQFPVNTKTGGLAFDISDMITAMKVTAKWAKKNNY